MLTDLVVSFTLDSVFKTLYEAEITNAKEYIKHTVSCGEWGEHTVLIHISYRSTLSCNQANNCFSFMASSIHVEY